MSVSCLQIFFIFLLMVYHLSVCRSICLSFALACTRWKAVEVASRLITEWDTFTLFCIPVSEFSVCPTVVSKRERICTTVCPCDGPLWAIISVVTELAADYVRTLNRFRIILAIAVSYAYFYGRKHSTQFAQDCLNQLFVERYCSFFCLEFRWKELDPKSK